MFNVLDKRDGIVSASQQAIFNKISTNNADGYIDGYLNSFRIIKATSSTISIDSGILSIQGYRVYNNDLFTHTVIFNTSKDLDFQLVAVFNHFVSSEKDNIEIVSRPVQTLRKDNLFANADAVYEVELAEFTLTRAGIADDFTVTLEKVVYNEQDLSELLDKVITAEENSSFAVEKVNELEKKIVDKQGTAVSVGGEIVTDLSFDSDPQAQIDGKADKTTTEKAIENLSKSVESTNTALESTNKAVAKKADNDDFIIAISSLESSINKKEPAFEKNTAFNKDFGTEKGTVCEGNDTRLSNARPASDVYAWAKAQNKPTYTKSEVGLGNVANERQYSAQNPPPYPVSVEYVQGSKTFSYNYGDNKSGYFQGTSYASLEVITPAGSTETLSSSISLMFFAEYLDVFLIKYIDDTNAWTEKRWKLTSGQSVSIKMTNHYGILTRFGG